MTDYTKEAEELYPSEYRNSADIYNKADLADAKQEAHIAARQQSAAEVDRLRGEVERLTMDNMTHEFNQAEAEKFAPEYERQIREDEANKCRGEVSKLREGLEDCDTLLAHLEDYAHGDGGKMITQQRGKIQQLLTETEGYGKILAKGGICSTTVDSSTNDG